MPILLYFDVAISNSKSAHLFGCQEISGAEEDI